MCQIKKDITVDDVKRHLFRIANQIKNYKGELTGRLVEDEEYACVTVVIDNQVLGINFFTPKGKEAVVC